MSNKSQGTSFEHTVAKALFAQGFWVHEMASKESGQPADIIAVKNHKAYLIDAKLCTQYSFDVSRVEENQVMAMRLWRKCGNGEGLFAMGVGSLIYMIPFCTMESFIKHGTTKLSTETIYHYGLSMKDWVIRCT